MRNRNNGFTLIELLVALAAMALLSIMSWRGIDGMLRAQEVTREQGEQHAIMQTVLAQWNADLNALMPLQGRQVLDWDGQVLRLTRRSSAGGGAGALVVAWSRREVGGTAQWLRWQSHPVATRGDWQSAWDQAAVWARSPGATERQGEVALLPLAGWQIYYFRGNAWSNPLSSRGAPATPEGVPASTALKPLLLVPDGIRLELDLGANGALAGRLTQDWVNPLNGGGKS